MKQNGFSLIELLIVLVIAGTLIAMSTFHFRGMSEKTRTEEQMKQVYADLMNSRTEAMFRKVRRHLVITATSFSVYSSGEVSVTPLRSRSLRYPVNTDPADIEIAFDSRGIATFNGDLAITSAAVCTQQVATGSVDSIAATQTQIMLGKQNNSGCSYANIAAQ